jgi:hypothetical protein
MPRVESLRSEILKLMRAKPFRPFALLLENGERVMIGHPENIAFEPGSPEGVGGSEEFYVISGGIRMFSTFGAITSIAMLDRGQI